MVTMNPIHFAEANAKFGPPEGFEESQVQTIWACRRVTTGGGCDGALQVVTAWMPTPEELKQLNEGKPVFLSFMGGLPPHYVSTSFESVTNLG